MSNVISFESKSSLAKLMATEDLSVEHKNVSTASFDVKNRVLTLPKWEEMGVAVYDGLIGHEIGHALFTPADGWKKAVEETSGFHSYLNVVEDARIEKKVRVAYPGMVRGFYNLYTDLMDKDFFGLRGKDINDYPLIDKINIHFKAGYRAGVVFDGFETEMVDMVAKADTWDEVVVVAKMIYEYAKEEQNEMDIVNDIFDVEDGDGDGDNDLDYDDGSEVTNDSRNIDSDGEGDSDGDDDEGEDGEDAGKASEQEIDPKSHTQSNFDETVEGMTDTSGRDNLYIDLPKVDEDKVKIPYSKVLKDMSDHYDTTSDGDRNVGDGYVERNNSDVMEAYNTSYNKFKKDSIPTVNYLVKEFEMKKAATAHLRTNISKTGTLDTNKMHSYKYNEDIFKRISTVKDGKNHGLIMYVDWSGSMYDNIFGTIKQTLNLVMFARKVGIPFEVYAFTNGMSDPSPFEFDKKGSSNVLVGKKLSLIQFFSHKMNTKQFNSMCKYFYFLGGMMSRENINLLPYWAYTTVPEGYRLGSTPLNEAIMVSIDMVNRFRSETGVEKIHTIFLTDGDTDGNSYYYDGARDCNVSFNGYRTDVYLRDPTTKVTRKIDAWNMTDDLLMFLRERTGAEAVGFFILANTKQMPRWKSWDNVAEGRKELKKNGFTTADGTGYSEFYLIKGGKDLDTSTEELTIKEDAKRGAMTTAFKKFAKGKRVSKVLLSRFVDMVA
jgi:hypothetical protein